MRRQVWNCMSMPKSLEEKHCECPALLGAYATVCFCRVGGLFLLLPCADVSN